MASSLLLVSVARASAQRSLLSISRRHFSSSPQVWRVDDPYTGSIIAEIPTIDESAAQRQINLSSKAQRDWRRVPLSDRIALLQKWSDAFLKQKDQIAADISHQMGKPLGQAKGEVETTIVRTKTLIDLAPSALSDDPVAHSSPFFKKISKEPVGVVLALVPWNYPLLCTVNSLAAALLAGNSVLIKQSERTPLCAEHFAKTFEAVGAPRGLVQALHADHELMGKLIAHPAIGYVAFTGSVSGGRSVYQHVARSRFIDVGLELGGKDPAYVAEDADLKYAIANVVDGAMYNAGQSCCAVERVYVHEAKYKEFLDGAVAIVKDYKLGNPFDSNTSMGPIAQPRHPAHLQRLVDSAKAHGARILAGGSTTHDANGKGRFFAPTVLADATHEMTVMVEEAFGPILTVAKVKSDEEAVEKMNDSPYGLTASIWTSSQERAERVMSQVNAGTVFMNRCDFLDPLLPWSGRKDSGKGFGLSAYGFLPYIRTKGYNFKTKTQ